MNKLSPQVLSAPKGFTLIELLVVIAVITLIAGVSIPALRLSRLKGQSMVCASHLEQLQWAWFLYVTDHDDRLPLNYMFRSENGGFSSPPESWVAGNARLDTSTDKLESGTLFPYLQTVKVYRCPSDRSTVTDWPQLLRNRSYALNALLSGGANSSRATVRASNRTTFSSITRPSPARVWAFLDCSEGTIAGAPFWMSPLAQTNESHRWLMQPSDRHNHGTNLSFADGHVAYKRWHWPKQLGLNTPAENDDDLQDLRWLQARLPRP